MGVGTEFWSRFKSVEDRLIFLASHRGALMKKANELLANGESEEALRMLESDPLGQEQVEEAEETRPAYYVLSVPDGLYCADSLFGLMKEVVVHRLWHLWYEGAWRD